MIHNTSKKFLISGNEAVALGALKAGLKFYAAYPMTPATSILHFLAKHEKDYNIIVKQTEDELAAINMTIGANVAGARSMCATSGGGFALMTEAFGLAGMIETPLVCAVVSRPGPATGVPTWTGQGDLRFILHSAPDEFPRIILAPGDALEAFQLSFNAFNLADKYQVPVVILSDKMLAESYFTVNGDDFTKGDFKIERGKISSKVKTQKLNSKSFQGKNQNLKLERYKITKDGVSARAFPGTLGKLFLANSDEHDSWGYSEEDSQNRIDQMDKRMRKLKTIVKDQALDLPQWFGPKKADITLISWGSSKGVCLEAVSEFQNQGTGACNLLHFNQLYPLNVTALKKELSKIKKSICVEGNYSGQFADYLYEQTGYKVDQKFCKYDGRPHFVEETVKKIFNF